jgi:uncharacterized membrane protein YkoI
MMKRILTCYAIVALFMAIGISSEKKVALKDLPAAAQKAVQDLIKGAELKGLSQEEENGKTVYEVETIKNGKSRDAVIDATGAILELEEETTLNEIPGPSKAAIEKAAANGKVAKVEVVTKGNSKTYEAAITKAGKKSEIKVTTDGSIVTK